jgi:tRNA dimethylallyltransferase
MAKDTSPPPVYLAGATATGKSAVAIHLAERLGGEIISVDSMQVYRGLDLGTAKPTLAERKRIPHHLIDVAAITETFDAARFIKLANAAIAEIQSRGRVPVLCGGTGLYFKALLEGLGEAPASDPKVRAELAGLPLPELLAELEKSDPVTFEKIDRQNPRRVIRALEVIRVTGKPFSRQRANWQIDGSLVPGFFGLRRAPSDLHARINVRVEQMFQQGLVAEVKSLLPQGLEQNQTAMQALGYRQVAEHLRGVRDLEETIELVKIRTRQFAKRQMTWFRRHARLKWIDCAPGESAEAIAAKILL